MLTFNYNIYIISKEKIKKGGRKMKEQFLELLKKVKREGIDELIQFLEKSDFLLHQQVQDFMEITKVVL